MLFSSLAQDTQAVNQKAYPKHVGCNWPSIELMSTSQRSNKIRPGDGMVETGLAHPSWEFCRALHGPPRTALRLVQMRIHTRHRLGHVSERVVERRRRGRRRGCPRHAWRSANRDRDRRRVFARRGRGMALLGDGVGAAGDSVAALSEKSVGVSFARVPFAARTGGGVPGRARTRTTVGAPVHRNARA